MVGADALSPGRCKAGAGAPRGAEAAAAEAAQQAPHPSLNLSRDARTSPRPHQFLRATFPTFPRSFPRVAAAAWLTCMLVCTVHVSLASASRPAARGSGCSGGMACLPLQLAARQYSLVLGLFCDMRAISERFAQRAGAAQGGAAWRVVGGGERGCRRAGHAPPHAAAAAQMARDAEGRGGEEKAGCRLHSVFAGWLCCSASFTRLLPLLQKRCEHAARAWLPNNALAT